MAYRGFTTATDPRGKQQRATAKPATASRSLASKPANVGQALRNPASAGPAPAAAISRKPEAAAPKPGGNEPKPSASAQVNRAVRWASGQAAAKPEVAAKPEMRAASSAQVHRAAMGNPPPAPPKRGGRER